MMERPVEIVVLPTAAEACLRAARIVAEVVAARPAAVIGWPAGRTPGPVYAELLRRHREEGLSLARVRAFNLDEYVGLGPDHPASFRRALDEELYRPVGLPAANARSPDGRASDPAAAARAYEAEIAAVGGFDLVLLGLGGNGHVAFNEPGSPIDAPTRVVALSAATRAANHAAFAPEEVPREAITIGIATILGARRVVLLATGAAKSGAVAQSINGPITADVPASALRTHAEATAILDEAAASRLTGARG
jgi:glucosamine-6-phosphate deaminase